MRSVNLPVLNCGVVGDPIGLSLSPALHQAGYEACNLDWVFSATTVAAGQLRDHLTELDSTWRGLAVTMPLKAEAAHLGIPDAATELVGVANTLVLDPNGIRAYNTDVSGLVRALGTLGITGLGNAVLVGAGATARSTLAALSRLGVHRVQVQVRNLAHTTEIQALGHRLGLRLECTPIGPHPATDLVVSTLPGDAADAYVDELLAGAGAVLDVRYYPWPNPLGTRAGELGVPLAGGIELLAGQAVDQFELFTGIELPIDFFLRVGRRALADRVGE